jgi:dipeptidyl aminopeptidase/acylaminoacyl peptidase
MKTHISLLLISILALSPLASVAQKGLKAERTAAANLEAKPAFDLSIDSIMRGNGLYGYEPRAVRWSSDSQKIYFEWKAATDPREKDWDTWVVSRDGGELRKLSEEEAKAAPPIMSGGFGGFGGGGRGGGGSMDRTRDKKWGVFAENGDLVLYEVATGKRRKLTITTESESSPRFTRDGRHVTFVRANNLYRISLDSGEIEQLTDIRSASSTPAAGGPPAGPTGGFGLGRGGAAAAASGDQQQRGTESQEYLKKEEKELLDIIKRRAAKREEDAAKRKKQADAERKPYTLQGRQTAMGFQLAPDEKYVIAGINEPAEGSKSSIVPNYVTESAYVEDIPGRGKVGDTQGRSRMAIVNVKTGDLKFVETGLKPLTDPAAAKTDAAPPVKPDDGALNGEATPTATLATESSNPEDAPAQAQTPARAQQGTGAQSGQSGRRPAAPPERDVTLSMPVWSEDGKRAVLIATSADFKDRWIMALDPDAAKVRILFAHHDDAWIRLGSGMFGWMKDDQTIYFQSERTGYAHLYTISYDGGEPRPLTSGKWEILSAVLSDDKTKFYLSTNEGSPFEVHYYSMPASGGERTRITSMTGHHNVSLSPDEKFLADIYSFSNRPPELYVLENKTGSEAKKITSSPLSEFWNYPWIDPPIVQVPARDGVMVPARMYKPKSWKPGGPGVIFVHGAGYAQNVHKWWSSNSQVYLFNHFLMKHGYLVLDVDYRGSAGYGRDWRTAIYRHMGGKDLDDQVDAAKWMAKEQGVDPKRIGIYGGSYGGFMTLMAMFNASDVFAAGAAMRPVTDWAHYNHGYTGSILNLPQNDAEAYKRSSPIYFAQNLKGALLICHGIVDTNVFFEDTVRLVQRLIELKKENWELAVYPVEDHGFVEPASWSDEYKRIFKLFETNLKKPAPSQPAGGSRAASKG